MLIRLVGTGSILSRRNSACTLIDDKVLIDCGGGIFKALRQQQVNLKKISTVLITHFHGDHYADLPCLILYRYLSSGEKERLVVYGPKGLVEKVKSLFICYYPDTNFEDAVRDGKIRSIGLSNWYVKELKEFLPQISIMPAVVQNEIHPYYQENDVIPYVRSLGIVMEGWYPFGGRGYTEAMFSNETLIDIAKKHDVTVPQVILRWNLQKGVVVIPGTENPDYVRENLDVFDFELSSEEMDMINALDRNEKHDWY